jgi:hypothetical protein
MRKKIIFSNVGVTCCSDCQPIQKERCLTRKHLSKDVDTDRIMPQRCPLRNSHIVIAEEKENGTYKYVVTKGKTGA